jgi:hypothetical protein
MLDLVHKNLSSRRVRLEGMCQPPTGLGVGGMLPKPGNSELESCAFS